MGAGAGAAGHPALLRGILRRGRPRQGGPGGGGAGGPLGPVLPPGGGGRLRHPAGGGQLDRPETEAAAPAGRGCGGLRDPCGGVGGHGGGPVRRLDRRAGPRRCDQWGRRGAGGGGHRVCHPPAGSVSGVYRGQGVHRRVLDRAEQQSGSVPVHRRQHQPGKHQRHRGERLHPLYPVSRQPEPYPGVGGKGRRSEDPGLRRLAPRGGQQLGGFLGSVRGPRRGGAGEHHRTRRDAAGDAGAQD